MKKILLTLCLQLLIVKTDFLTAQVNNDPFAQTFKVGGSAELFIGYSDTEGEQSHHCLIDPETTLDDIDLPEGIHNSKYLEIRKSAAAGGDFNGDGNNEIVYIKNNTSGGIKITIPIFKEDDLTEINEKTYTITDLGNTDIERIRLCVGNFDYDPAEEFAICYGPVNNLLTISIFETDADLNISLLSTYNTIAYYDIYFDIAAGNLIGDVKDEIAFVKNNEETPIGTGIDNDEFVESDYSLGIYAFDTTLNSLREYFFDNNIKIENEIPEGYFGDAGQPRFISEIRIACGNIFNDTNDEIVIAWAVQYNYAARLEWFVTQRYYNVPTFLHVLDLSSPLAIKNKNNLPSYYVGRYKQKGYVIDPTNRANEHIALSLISENLDNVSYDEIMVNGPCSFNIFTSNGNTIVEDVNIDWFPNFKSESDDFDEYLNIKGNEAFVVADLNPDTMNQNYNKEIILLKSDKNINSQIHDNAETTTLQIYEIETINTDTIILNTSIQPNNLSFGKSKIEITSLAANDLDVNDAQIYRVGSPDVFNVTEMQQPIVILNAPPIHFDVLEGEIHDLCNAYNDEGTEFSATYSTEVNNNHTTNVKVTNNWGLSNELGIYAETAGTGFKNLLSGQWEWGKDSYKGSTLNESISQSHTVSKEDYILNSSLDYSYYRYPVYNKNHEEIGKIAVLNPTSEELTTKWSSGNSWDNPSYIINHEPGNLLSYRPYKNTEDIFTETSDFSFVQYDTRDVSETGGRTFSFTFDKLTDKGDAVSFAAGVGNDYFAKVGYEGEAQVNAGFLGNGASQAINIKMGVSFELAVHYDGSKLATHTTQIDSLFQIDGVIGMLDDTYGAIARYEITPYIYRSQSGAIVLDYMVNLDVSENDWWEDNYGQYPDLAFILPWRYATEKGNMKVKPSKKQKTNEIQFYTPLNSPGDTVSIKTRVHNYSLHAFEDVLKVDYYLGDPNSGGIKLTDIDGNTGSIKTTSMNYGLSDPAYDFEEYLIFNWQVPDTITCSPRIYAVIDPENEYEEIHENNNIGWNTLQILNCEECKYGEPLVNSSKNNFYDSENNFKVYPNPFSSETNIMYTLDSGQDVEIAILSITGQVINILAKGYYPTGGHIVKWTGSNQSGYQVAEGLYFCRITTGNTIHTEKIILKKP